MFIDKHITCTRRPTIGDPVLVIGGPFKVGERGVITRLRGLSKYEVRFANGEVRTKDAHEVRFAGMAHLDEGGKP